MNEKNENMIKIDNEKKEKDLCKEKINGIVCKEDLHPFFKHSDHSINNVHFSKANIFIIEYFI